MKRLTNKQKKVLVLIWKGIEKRRLPPTSQELADALGVTTTAAQQHVTALIKKGCVQRVDKNKARSMRLTKIGWEVASGERVNVPLAQSSP